MRKKQICKNSPTEFSILKQESFNILSHSEKINCHFLAKICGCFEIDFLSNFRIRLLLNYFSGKSNQAVAYLHADGSNLFRSARS